MSTPDSQFPFPRPAAARGKARPDPALGDAVAEGRAIPFYILLLPLLLGALVRAAAVFYFSHVHYQYPDEDIYWELGQRFLEGHGISLAHDTLGGFVRANEPTAYYGALMAPVVAVLRILTRGHISIARLILGEASWFGVALPMTAYARLHLSRGRAALFILVLALFPNLHFIGSFVMTENILIPFVCLALYLGAKIRIRAPGNAHSIPPLAGTPASRASEFSTKTPMLIAWSVVFGLVHLVKMNLLLFQPIQFLIDTRKMSWRKKAVSGIIAIAVTGAVLFPWVWRDHKVMGTWALETKSGYNLWDQNNPNRDKPILQENFAGPASTMPSYDGLTEAQRNAACKKLFEQFFVAHPMKFAQLCISRFSIAYALTPVSMPVSMKLSRIVAFLYGTFNAAVYFFALLGLKQCFRRKWFFDAAGLVIYTVIITALTNAAFRHRSYADPAMLLLSVLGFLWVFDFLFPPRPTAD